MRVVTSGDNLSAAWNEAERTLSISLISSEVDHGGLTGLADNDHAQYLLTTGSASVGVASQIPSVTHLWTPFQLSPGRLTLSTGNPAPTTDLTAQTTLYYEPYGFGDVLGIYDGSTSWAMLSIGSGLSLSLAGLTSNTNYDVFVYSNSGTPTLEALAWTDSTTRATGLTLVNGVYCKTGQTTRRYLGTFRTTGTTGQCEFSRTKRYLWNMHHRLEFPVAKGDSTVSWTYGTAAWRQARADANNQVDWVQGLSLDTHRFTLGWCSSATVATTRFGGIGINSTTPTANAYSAIGDTVVTSAAANLAGGDSGGNNYRNGLNSVIWCEFGSATGTVTFFGVGSVECLKGTLWL